MVADVSPTPVCSRTHLDPSSAAKAAATGGRLGRGPSEAVPGDTRRFDGWWVGGELEMAQELTDVPGATYKK